MSTEAARSSAWEDVIGQEQVTALLAEAAGSSSAMTHAWLITGPPGSGRSVAARAFAAALQCRDVDDEGRPGCGHCHSCQTVFAGTHPDVLVMSTEAVTISIADVRALVSVAQRSPSQGRWRVIIIDDADRMVERTANVLLKAIEEPPERTVWVLCAPSPQDVITTVRSRCRQLGLRVPPVSAVVDLLASRDGIDPATARAAALAAQCHIGLARRLATSPQASQRRRDVLAIPARIRGVGDAVLAAGNLVELAQAEAVSATEERNAVERADLLRALGAEDARTLPPTVRAQVRQLEENQKRRAKRVQIDVLDRAMVDLLSLYRDVLVRQLGATVEAINEDLVEVIDVLARQSTSARTMRRIEAITEARARLAANVAPLLAVEAMVVQLRPQSDPEDARSLSVR